MPLNINRSQTKLSRLAKNPRKILLHRLLSFTPPQAMTTLARYELVNPIAIADHMSANRMWQELKELANIGDELILSNLRAYLGLKPGFLTEEKHKISGTLAHEIKSVGLLQKLSPEMLLSVSRVLGQFSFFEAASVCRFACLGKYALSTQPGSFQHNAIRAELSGVDVDLLQYFADRYGLSESIFNSLIGFVQKTTVDELLKALKSNSKSLQDMRQAELDSGTRKIFEQLVSARVDLAKKTILLIGPSVRASDTISRADFDFVARIGYRGTTSIAGFDEWRTDISFYKDHKLDDLSSAEISSIARSLDMMIVSGISSSTLERFEDIRNFSYSPMSGATLISAECSAGLEAVLGFLDAGARSIYISNTDLFLNSVYPKGYKSNNYNQIGVVDGWVLESAILCRSLARHHAPSAQYGVYHALWRTGRVKGDGVFEDIMKNGLIWYLKRLEETYHPFLAI